MKLLRVKFSKLFEVNGAFAQDCISPAGGIFPKHLICSYDLKARTIIFPIEWTLSEAGGTNMDNWTRTEWRFNFGEYCTTVLQHKLIEKIDFVEVDYDSKEFQPNKDLVLLTLSIPRRNKNRTDNLIHKHKTAQSIVAVRSKKSSMAIVKSGSKEKTVPQYFYDIIMKKSCWKDFAEQLYKQKIISEKDRFAILISGNPVFPRQLASFQNSK